MHSDISHKVDEVLKEKGIDIRYDPDKQTCKTWYGLKLKVNYKASGKLSNANPLKRELNINTNTLKSDLPRTNINELKINSPRTIEHIAAVLLHEKTHIDIAPIETPAAVIGLYYLFRSIDNPIKAAVVTIIAARVYSRIIREYIVEGINYVRYRLNILNCKKWD